MPTVLASPPSARNLRHCCLSYPNSCPRAAHRVDYLRVFIRIDIVNFEPLHLDDVYAVIVIWTAIWECVGGSPANDDCSVPREALCRY